MAIITSGASGMGEATASHFATHGARAIVIADVQDEKGQNVVLSIGPNICTYVHYDVSDEEQVKTLVDSTVNTYGRLDIMFSNAGLSAYDKLMVVNTRGMVASVKHTAKVMVEGRVRGSIICIASLAVSIGLVGTPLLKEMLGFENDEEVDKVVELSSNLKGGVLRPKNVADAVVFLASEDSQFVTGHNLVVDAGFRV
ncbi:hypothetical protein SO802_020650 [Lithocarpus litseifolius]|uniref:Uncharacterized protein n=1 Tax=Lithocarpus litseifolius TaxID=425828 RepID=A0AAW2CCN1_9ROSI